MPYAPKRHGQDKVDANRKAVRYAYEHSADRKESQRFYNSKAWKTSARVPGKQPVVC